MADAGKHGRNCVGLVVLLVLVAGCGGKAAPEVAWIGHIAPLHDAERGQSARQGVRLAVDEWNQAPAPGRTLAVRHADDEGKEPGPVAVRMVSVNHVTALLGGMSPATGASLADVARPYSVPLVCPCGLAKGSMNPYIFPLGMSPAFQGQLLARFAAGDLKARRAMAIVRQSEDKTADGVFRADFARAFLREFQKRGGTVSAERIFRGVVDLGQDLKQAAGDKVDALLVVGSVEDLTEARKEPGLEKAAILYGAAEEVPPSALPALPGPIYLAATFAADDTAPAVRGFVKKYEDHYGQTPDASAALAYDCARFVGEGIRKSESLEGAKLQEALAAITPFDGVTGQVFRAEDGSFARPCLVLRVQDGKAKLVKRFEAEKQN